MEVRRECVEEEGEEMGILLPGRERDEFEESDEEFERGRSMIEEGGGILTRDELRRFGVDFEKERGSGRIEELVQFGPVGGEEDSFGDEVSDDLLVGGRLRELVNNCIFEGFEGLRGERR